MCTIKTHEYIAALCNFNDRTLFNGVLCYKQQSNVTDVLEKLCEVDIVSQIDLRKWRARQALITDIVFECIHSVL